MCSTPPQIVQSPPQNSIMTGIRRVIKKMVIAGFHECLAGKAFLRDTREIFCFAILSYLLYYILTHTIYTIITHIC